MPTYSAWELLSFSDEQLQQRLKTMTWQEREAERLAKYQKYLATQSNQPPGEPKNEQI